MARSDGPAVCIAHRRFIPCRWDNADCYLCDCGDCVSVVRAYQSLEAAAWELDRIDDEIEQLEQFQATVSEWVASAPRCPRPPRELR